MALIECEECNKKYSNKAKACPNCGCPTISNTIDKERENIEECSVKIDGNENLNTGGTFLDGLLGFIIGIFLAALYIGNFKTNGFVPLFIIIFSLVASYYFPKSKKKREKVNIINEYFKNRFSILDTIPDGCNKTSLIDKSAEKQSYAMFDIYMEAYKFDADAIVLNNNTTSTEVTGGNRNKKVKSSTTHHITATLIKY